MEQAKPVCSVLAHFLRQSLAGHCQRQAGGLEQPMAWPGLLQQCSLLLWVTVGSWETAAHGLLGM